MTYSLVYSRAASYFHGYIVCILVAHAFEFKYGKIIAKLLIDSAFWGVALILIWVWKMRHLLESDALLEAWYLLYGIDIY